jgi:hypothetical protein
MNLGNASVSAGDRLDGVRPSSGAATLELKLAPMKSDASSSRGYASKLWSDGRIVLCSSQTGKFASIDPDNKPFDPCYFVVALLLFAFASLLLRTP